MKRNSIINRMIGGILSGLSYTFPFSLNSKKPQKLAYNLNVVMAKENQIISCANLIGGLIAVIIIGVILSVQGFTSISTLIAGIFIALGISKQIISICLMAVTADLRAFISKWTTILYTWARLKSTHEWNHIEENASQIYISPYIIHAFPKELGIRATPTEILKFVKVHKYEMKYFEDVNDSNAEQLSFSDHALDFIGDRLGFHDRIHYLQERSGALDPVLFIAIGTIIWLVFSH